MSFIPEKCNFIFNILRSRGFECFAVGGCVRDTLMGKTPADWDFTTNATPDEILDCFSEYTTIDIGKRFGTICVVSDGVPYEITTYRSDGEYSDSRHPDYVEFSSDLADDLSRRDFTVNSMAFSENSQVIDLYGGQEDINNKFIRTTGVADIRFKEDALRMLRALRFSSQLGFDIEAETAEAIHKNRERLLLVHPQRIRKELTGILMGDNFLSVLSNFRDTLSVVIPELFPMFDLEQNNPHHIYDVWTHTLKALSFTPKDEIIRLAVLFHDIGKPICKTTDDKGVDHFKKHPHKSEELTSKILIRFGYPSKMVSKICTLVRFHDERFHNMSADIKRVMRVTGPELFFTLLQVSRADMLAQSPYLREDKLSHHKKVSEEAKRIIESGECYTLSQLAVKGSDLQKLGFKGSAISDTLDTLLMSVIKGKMKNNRDELITAAKTMLCIIDK